MCSFFCTYINNKALDPLTYTIFIELKILATHAIIKIIVFHRKGEFIMIPAIVRNDMINGLYRQYNVSKISDTTASESTDAVGKASKSECQTCKERKYVDGSNEGNVSFKSPGHISPEASAAVVSAHESEHVANAKSKGSQEGNKLISASVSLKVAICPECGRSYVSGGTTRTTIKYSEKNPYDQGRKVVEGSFLRGQSLDLTA
jgi:hypothetical protein